MAADKLPSGVALMILRLRHWNTCPGFIALIKSAHKGRTDIPCPRDYLNSPRRHTQSHHLSVICLIQVTPWMAPAVFAPVCLATAGSVCTLLGPTRSHHSCWGQFWEPAHRRMDKPTAGHLSQCRTGWAEVQSCSPHVSHWCILVLLQLIAISKTVFLFMGWFFFST